MKFTSETLLQIYMDGSFTEEAQAEFDVLVRKDPVFAEKVSRAVAERVGESPESLLGQVESRLDGKMAELWEKHQPSPYGMWFKRAVVTSAIFLGALGFYYLFQHYGQVFHWASTSGSGVSQPPASSDATVVSAVGPRTSTHRANRGLTPSRKEARLTRSTASSVEAVNADLSQHPLSALPPVSSTGPKGISPVAASVPSQAGNGMGPSGLPLAPPLVSNPGVVLNQNPSPAGQANVVQPPFSNQIPTGAPPLEPALPSSQGVNPPTGDETPLSSISIEIQRTQNVLVTVLDSNGKQVRQLYQGQWNAGTHMVNWDGKDDLGNPVLPGNYTVLVNSDGKTMSGMVTVQPNNDK